MLRTSCTSGSRAGLVFHMERWQSKEARCWSLRVFLEWRTGKVWPWGQPSSVRFVSHHQGTTTGYPRLYVITHSLVPSESPSIKG